MLQDYLETVKQKEADDKERMEKRAKCRNK
jgi:hypothetical protein